VKIDWGFLLLLLIVALAIALVVWMAVTDRFTV
jgi:hypothetical protein